MPGSKRKKKEDEDYADEEEQQAPMNNTLDALDRAREYLQDITGAVCESITGFERIDGGWRVRGVVAEVRRIPPTTDILASYEVEVDEAGELVRCQRVNRYWRSQALTEGASFGNGYE